VLKYIKKECHGVSFIGYLRNSSPYIWPVLESSSRVIMNGEFKNMWKKVTEFSFKRMWEIANYLIVTDTVLWGFCVVILHAERLSFGHFAL